MCILSKNLKTHLKNIQHYNTKHEFKKKKEMLGKLVGFFFLHIFF